MNFRWVRGLSSIHLILGYHGGHRAYREKSAEGRAGA
jgi:hypothetical protein